MRVCAAGPDPLASLNLLSDRASPAFVGGHPSPGDTAPRKLATHRATGRPHCLVVAVEAEPGLPYGTLIRPRIASGVGVAAQAKVAPPAGPPAPPVHDRLAVPASAARGLDFEANP